MALAWYVIILLKFACSVASVLSKTGLDCGNSGGVARAAIPPLHSGCGEDDGEGIDPIFSDFTGSRFEFFGDAGLDYSLYADAQYQVNAGLVSGITNGQTGSYIGQIGATLHEFRVNVSLLEDGDVQVEAWQEGEGLEENEKHTMLASSAAGYRAFGRCSCKALTIVSGAIQPSGTWATNVISEDLVLKVWSVPRLQLRGGGGSFLHMNLTLQTAPVGDSAEGVLGESLSKALQARKSSTAHRRLVGLKQDVTVFEGKGLTVDYRVDGLFGNRQAFALR